MKNIKWKEFLLEKGEIVGLAAAGALTLLLLVLLLVPRLFVGSAKAHAKELNDMSAKLKQDQDRAIPGPQHKPGPVGDVTQTYLVKEIDAAEYPTRLAFFPPIEKDRKRQRPEVFAPAGFHVAFFRGQFPRMVLVNNDAGKPTKVWVLKNAAGAEGTPAGMPAGMKPGKGFGQGLQGMYNGGMAGAGRPGAGGMGGPATLRNIRRRGGKKPLDLTDKIELVDIASAENRSLATEALAQRMILVEASFPYKRQVQEFMDKLRLDSHGAVLSEQVKGKDGKAWPSFQFRSLVIERTTLDRDGKEGPWERLMGRLDPKETVERQPFDLYQVYNELRILLPPKYREEEEDPKLQAVLDASRGLVMKVPAQYGKDKEKNKRKSPKLTYSEKEDAPLPKIQKTVQQLLASGKKSEDITPPLLRQEDPFGLGSGKEQKNTYTPSPPAAGQGPGYGNIPGDFKLKETPIDYCLIRFIDPSVEGGKTYKYRIRVKMANPNYSPDPDKRTDTYPHFAAAEELVASAWATTPPVSVQPDDFLYAVDEAKLNPKAWGRVYRPNDNQAVFQMHRWVTSYTASGGNEQGVGDWLVAKRFFVERGEFVHTHPNFALEVPVHRLDNPQLTLDTRPGVRRGERTDQIPLPFGDESILVDFEGGDRVPYKRTVVEGEKTRTMTIEDRATTEVLIMRPDGKMIAHNTIADANNPVRKRRYEDYLKRVDEARNGPKKTGNGNGFDTP